ncbi:MAG: DUF3078 domain-containing protein [Flammeovirgaceae bacterium]
MKGNISYLYLLFFLMAYSQVTIAQEKKEAEADSTSSWKSSGSVGLTFANVGLENWAGGGVSSISLGFVGNYKVTRDTKKMVWDNQFDFAYGLLRQRGNETFRKTDDQLIILSQIGYKLNKKWLVTALLNFRTQVSPGYTYGEDSLGNETRTRISNLLAPGYLTVNTGITFKEKDFLTATLAPVTIKNTFVLDDAVNEVDFGLGVGQRVRSEFGINLLANVTKKVMENVNFTTNLSLFANYGNLGAIDVNWEALLAMKVNKYINASFGTQLIYDEEVIINGMGSKVQFKHALNIGFGYTF